MYSIIIHRISFVRYTHFCHILLVCVLIMIHSYLYILHISFLSALYIAYNFFPLACLFLMLLDEKVLILIV